MSLLDEKWEHYGRARVKTEGSDGQQFAQVDGPFGDDEARARAIAVLPEALAYITHVAECLNTGAMIEGHTGEELLRRAGVFS